MRPIVLDVGGTPVVVKPSMKYLGVILDARLSFRKHVDYVSQKVGGIARSLGRLMPNMRGPREHCRRLYANVVLSVVLYAAPVWSQRVSDSRKSRESLNKILRSTCLRVAAAYRTASLDAASLLARIPPVHLLAQMRARIYIRVTDLRAQVTWSLSDIRAIHLEEMVILRRQWEIYLSRPGVSGIRTVSAIRPHLGA